MGREIDGAYMKSGAIFWIGGIDFILYPLPSEVYVVAPLFPVYLTVILKNYNIFATSHVGHWSWLCM